jgi:hypothetical protein
MMPFDPWEVLGVRRDASFAEAKAAYLRVAALFHPDHLQGMSEAVRAEGERRLREATAALESLRGRLRVQPGPDGDRAEADRLAAESKSRAYNAQVRGLDADGLHATWPGRHAGAVWAAMRRAHTVDGPVRQVEWGAYECTLPGAAVRRILSEVLSDSATDWRREPLELLDVGPAGRRRRRVGRPGEDPPGVMDLEALAGLVEDRQQYLVTAEVFSGFD